MTLATFLHRTVFSAVVLGISAKASDLTIHLPGNAPVEHRKVTLSCDAVAVKLGLPGSPFEVEYIAAPPAALAVLPIEGKQLVFANVISASGARYAAGRYVWWDAGSRGISLSAPSADGEEQRGVCQMVKSK